MKYSSLALIGLAQMAILTFSLGSAAETTQISIKSMHCSSCAEEITEAVCKSAEFKGQFDKCEVSDVNAKTKIGKLEIVTKAEITKTQKDLIKIAVTGTGREITEMTQKK